MRQLALFAKHWQPGRVKTRLARSVGSQSAADLQRVFIEALLVRMATSGDQRACVYAPADRGPEFAQLAETVAAGRNWTFVAQAEGDLGRRMGVYLDAVVRREDHRVVVIGSDSPHLPVAWVERAFRLLDEAAVVLGPCRDGGYYLLGVRRPLPPIFERISWGTDLVLQQTVARLDEAGCTYRLLPTWCDVDDQADLDQLVLDLADPCRARQEPELRRLADRIRLVLDRGPGLG